MFTSHTRVLRCVTVAVLLPATVALAGEPTRVSDLRFGVSEPLPFPVPNNVQILPPSGLDANGLVAITVIDSTTLPYVWDSTTGEVTALLPDYASSGRATGVNRHGIVSGYIHIPIGGGNEPAWGVTWDTTSGPIVDDPMTLASTYGWLPRGHSDAGLIIGGGSDAFLGRIVCWDPVGTSWSIDDSGLATHYDISNAGRATFTHVISSPKPFRSDFPFSELVQLPLPTAEEIGFVADTASPNAINSNHQIVGNVQAFRAVRWNSDDTYDILGLLPDGALPALAADIADNGIIIGRTSEVVLWDPISLEPTKLNDLIDPALNPLGYTFLGGDSVGIGGIDSNAAVTRIAIIGWEPVDGARWVVLTAVTPGQTANGNFEGGSLAEYTLVGPGSAEIIDDPYTPGNSVLELEGIITIGQDVSTPQAPFDIGWLADIPIPDSPLPILQVLLGDVVVGQFTAEQLTSGALAEFAITVDDPALLGQSEIPLQFAWDDPGGAGPGTTALIIDDIVMRDAPPPPACPADVNASNAVDFQDLLALLAAWGPCDACPEDIDESGGVGFADLLTVLASWGPCP